MPNIIDSDFNGTPDRAILMGSMTSSVDSTLVREMAWGANWRVVRHGILCGLVEHPSQSYHRRIAVGLGVSSGSRTYCHNVSDRTFIGTFIGNAFDRYGTFAQYCAQFTSGSGDSGSFFTFDVYGTPYAVSGTFYSSPAAYDGKLMLPNLTSRKRKSMLIWEISQSVAGASLTSTLYGIASSSVISKNADRDWTVEDLKSALTGSGNQISASGIGLDKNTTNSAVSFNSASFPLNCVFLSHYGAVPLEVYDWYIYKVA